MRAAGGPTCQVPARRNWATRAWSAPHCDTETVRLELPDLTRLSLESRQGSDPKVACPGFRRPFLRFGALVRHVRSKIAVLAAARTLFESDTEACRAESYSPTPGFWPNLPRSEGREGGAPRRPGRFGLESVGFRFARTTGPDNLREPTTLTQTAAGRMH